MYQAQQSAKVLSLNRDLQGLKWVTHEETEAISSEHPSCIRKARQIAACNDVRNLRLVQDGDGDYVVSAYVHSEYKPVWYSVQVCLPTLAPGWEFECVCKQRYGVNKLCR